MTHIQQRRDTFAAWTLVNPVLMDGEAGHERDTGRWKLGDGVTPYIDLPYKSGVDSVAGKTGVVTLDVADVAGAAPLASPTFTGTPKATTPSALEDSTRIATTEWVRDLPFAPLASPAFTGNPTAPTPTATDDDTSIATTGYVQDNIGLGSRLGPTEMTQRTTSYNAMTEAGWYVMSGTAPDGPVAATTYLEVRASGTDYVMQTATLVSGNGSYTRFKTSPITWGAWKFEASDNNIGISAGSGWVSSNSSGYRRGNIMTVVVDITRDAQSGIGPANVAAAYVPTGYRPPAQIYTLGVDSASGGSVAIYMTVSGEIRFIFGRAAGSVSLGFFTYAIGTS